LSWVKESGRFAISRDYRDRSEFLQRPEEEWPNDLACENTDPIAIAEVTKHKTSVIHSSANQAIKAKPLNSDISTVTLLTVSASVLKRDY
jgi:hypothetical protein